MKSIFTVILLLPFYLLAQKTPIGILVKFNEATSFQTKADLVRNIQGLSPLNPEHVLTGFDVTLIEGANDYSKSQYNQMRLELQMNENVIYTSIIYRSESGTIAADLQELYFKPKESGKIHNLDQFNHKDGIRSKEQILSYRNFPFWQIKPHDFLEGVFVATYRKSNGDIRRHQAEMIATGLFEFVSVNTLHSVLATSSDPYFENQWALQNEGTPIHFNGTAGADMSVPEAWDITEGSPTIKIAVLDSGTDTNHVDLISNLLPGYDATGGGSKGYPNTTYSNDAHGTCSAGIIGAVGNNDEGIAGVAYQCKLIPVKIFYYISFGGDVIPFTSTSAGTTGINWAVNTANADVLSNSWGLRAIDIITLGIDTAVSNLTIRNRIASGRDGKGVPMLFSSGNEGDDFSIWPASLKETISVGASTMCDELKDPTDCSPEGWWGSNYGDNLDVTAPGVKVLSTDLSGALGYNSFVDDNYAMFNGTSAACPNAAGVMALILSVAPELSGSDARAVLSITADKTGGYAYDESNVYGMWSDEMGYGRVNAYEAVNYATNFSSINSSEVKNAAFIASGENGTFLMLNGNDFDEVAIYNLAGQMICVIPATTLASGSINLNDFILSSGLYLINLRTGNDSSVLKAVIAN